MRPSSGGAQVGLHLLDGHVLLKGPAEFREPWRTLWNPLLEGSIPSDSPVIQVCEEPWGYALKSPGRDVNVTDPWRALIESRNDAVRLALASTQGVIDLHGAVLVQDEQALLLLGDAWAGKTTLTLALVEEGWGYFSDDLVVIEDLTGLVRPVPKPPGIKAQGWDEMAHYWGSPPAHFGEPRGPFVIPPPFTGSTKDRASPRWIVSLEYDSALKEPQVRLLSKAESLTLAGEHLGVVNEISVSLLALVTSKCRHVVLRYSHTLDALRLIDDLVV